jgi:ubiquitin C-terminal hydrolase
MIKPIFSSPTTTTQNLTLLNKKLQKNLPFYYGLKNHGNTCFMNSILQCLFHTSPLAHFFISIQYERDMQIIIQQQQQQQLQQQKPNFPKFILTRHFYRLLNSMWTNRYEISYSSELKSLIGLMNPTFAGYVQNDAHELCLWILDKLSDELTIYLPLNNPQPPLNKSEQPKSSSFINELFQIKFKSTLICSVCNHESSKYETDMILSLPLPQYKHQLSRFNSNNNEIIEPSLKTNRLKRFSIYLTMIFNDFESLKRVVNNSIEWPSDPINDQSQKFEQAVYSDYNNKKVSSQPLNHNSGIESTATRSTFYIDNSTTIDGDNNRIKIGFNIYLQNNHSSSSLLPNSISNLLSKLDLDIVNPRVRDLKRYLTNFNIYKQHHSWSKSMNDDQFVLFDSKKMTLLNDNDSINDTYNSHDPLPSLTLLQLYPILDEQIPLINIININCYYDPLKRHFVSHGFPSILLMNRDCTYSELCYKILENQLTSFKDRNILKYQQSIERLFSISVVEIKSDNSVKLNRLDSNDDLPLYTEWIESSLSNNNSSFIQLNVQWKSKEDISRLFKDNNELFTFNHIHKSAKLLEKYENDFIKRQQQQQQQHQQQQQSKFEPKVKGEKLSVVSLDDCFDLFTQSENLTDDNSWMCPKCKKEANASKRLQINSVPSILIIHLKRFYYESMTSNSKLTTPVWFPIYNLDMKKYLDTNTTTLESDNNNNNIYDLFAVCNHEGQNMMNGHYTGIQFNSI